MVEVTPADVQDPALHRRFADDLFTDTGFDLRGQQFEPFYAVDMTSAPALGLADGHLDVTIWRPGEDERVVRKH